MLLCSLTLFLPSLAQAMGQKTKVIVNKEKYIDNFYQVDKEGNDKLFIFLNGQKLATVDHNIYFNIDDHLSSPTIITDQDGNIVEINDYDNFGELIYSSSTIDNSYKFSANELDSETDLGYFHNRYYDMRVARFMSIDPLLIYRPANFLADPQQLNSYSYARNNPVDLVDRDGNKVSEFQPYYSSNEFYNYGDKYGNYRGLDIVSAGDRSGDGDHNYQCVSLAKSFASNEYNIDLGGTGDARAYGNQSSFKDFNNKDSGDYTVYKNGGDIMPQENDIISWSGGSWGHVGVITEVSFNEKTNTGYVYTLEQNYSGKQALYTQKLNKSYSDNGNMIYIIENRSKSLEVQGWARYSEQSSVPYSNILYTPAPKNYIYE